MDGQRNAESNTEHRHHREMTYLCSINDVYFAFDGVGYVSSSQPAVFVHSRCGSSGVIQVAGHHAGTFDVHLPVYFVLFNEIALDVFQSIIDRYSRSHIHRDRNPYLIRMPGSILPILPVSSPSGQKNTMHQPVSVMPQTCVTLASGDSRAWKSA